MKWVIFSQQPFYINTADTAGVILNWNNHSNEIQASDFMEIFKSGSLFIHV